MPQKPLESVSDGHRLALDADLLENLEVEGDEVFPSSKRQRPPRKRFLQRALPVCGCCS
jgi:hypothetical protein